jgi:cell division protein FtsB
MAVTFRSIVYAGEGQEFFRQLVAEIERLQTTVARQQTEIDYLKRRVD